MTHCNSMLPVSLIILAAGLGRRFGGDKQLATIGDTGKPLMYHSVMDAYQAGVRHLVLVINRQIEQAISNQFFPLLPGDMQVSLVQQRLDDLPGGYEAGSRQKPWGTGHALWCARNVVPGACIVINADDYYGAGAMSQLLPHFEARSDWAMLSYQLDDTLSESGAVNRGLCEESGGYLVAVKECLSIAKANGVIHGELDGRQVQLEPETPVSMNIWGFGPDIFPDLEKGLLKFLAGLRDEGQEEFYLPSQVMASISAGDQKVRVYRGKSRWEGVTYREDLDRLADIFS